MRSIIHGVVSPKFARTPDWAPMKPILRVRDWARAMLTCRAPAAEASPATPPALRNARRLTLRLRLDSSWLRSTMATSVMPRSTRDSPALHLNDDTAGVRPIRGAECSTLKRAAAGSGREASGHSRHEPQAESHHETRRAVECSIGGAVNMIDRRELLHGTVVTAVLAARAARAPIWRPPPAGLARPARAVPRPRGPGRGRGAPFPFSPDERPRRRLVPR